MSKLWIFNQNVGGRSKLMVIRSKMTTRNKKNGKNPNKENTILQHLTEYQKTKRIYSEWEWPGGGGLK